MYQITKLHRRTLKDIIAPDGVKTDETPDMIMIHAGFHDLWSGRPAGEVVTDIENIIWDLLEYPNLKICMSLIIQTKGIYPVTNQRIEYVNREVTAIISDLRHRNPELRDRLFTSNNNSLSGCLSRPGLSAIMGEQSS